ncbi:ciliaflagella47-likeassociated and flagella-associated 47-like isoform X2 [Octopus vulgaris]|uniref:Ciliaflagella47-likeassociated and flagella-associated 47-like isoform X2 n=1 Tax=Octopus vulgaris TaxID=6645 RepID=A0AA36AT16_OCTVU|nr:ciliaflagella47-likeassociated and flagella-associated 47-like isoform X2 [Octopus vulgaris]
MRTFRFSEVKLENSETRHVIISGRVIYQELELMDPETEKIMEKIQFGYCYYGCDLIQFATLYNNSPIPAKFVAVVDEKADGEETECNITEPASLVLMKKAGLAEGKSNVHSGLLDILPYEGTLTPYEKILVAFLFKPRWELSPLGWKCLQEPPPRRDFVLFVNFNIVGIPFPPENQPKHGLEVPITGTALPVLLSLEPEKYHFGSCAVGMRSETEAILLNYSPVLPANYHFNNGAHFRAHPYKGVLQPGQQERITFSFIPKQIGALQSKNDLQVQENISSLYSDGNPFSIQKFKSGFPYYVSPKVIYSADIQMQGFGVMKPLNKDPKFNMGITPYITNEVGLYSEITFGNIKQIPRNAMAAARHYKILKEFKRSHSEVISRSFVAMPNDMAQSIRPSRNDKIFRTLFTKKKRYTYNDPDYSYTKHELEQIIINKSKYKDLISKATKMKIHQSRAIEFKKFNNDVDIGLAHADGIKPKKLQLSQIPTSTEKRDAEEKIICSSQFFQDGQITKKPANDGLNVIPTTNEEKIQCSRLLSPGQLHKLMIGPSKIDFGKVCQKSVNTQNLDIINTLDMFVFVQLHLDCPELTQTCPLSKVVHPFSKTGIPIVFESYNKGMFSTSIHYTINNCYTSCICVQAEVVNVNLEILTGSLAVLNPIPSMPPESGVVDEFKDLDCEVTWLPSYSSPEVGSFTLDVNGGQSILLECRAQIGLTAVQFSERRITFLNAPVNLTTKQVATLINTSGNHAYFKILDQNPVTGMYINPATGIVPAGGEVELRLSFTPTTLVKFDFNLEVDIRGWKVISVRVGGFVNNPCVEIDVPDFIFGGVYCGSMATIPFNIINKLSYTSYTCDKSSMNLHCAFKILYNIHRILNRLICHVVFKNLIEKSRTTTLPKWILICQATQTSDLTSMFHKRKDVKMVIEECVLYESDVSGMYSIHANGNTKVEGKLVFEPTEVAAYNFLMPVFINHTAAPAPPPHSSPHDSSETSTASKRHLNARTTLAQIVTPRRRSQEIVVENKTNHNLRYDLDLNILETYNNRDVLKFPELKVECPSVTCDDNKVIEPFRATILDNDTSEDIICCLSFRSEIPVSFRGLVKFTDQYENCFQLTVVAIADNCLLSCYSFLVHHQLDYKIICQPGTSLKGPKSSSNESVDAGEAICVPCDSSLNSISENSSSVVTSVIEESSIYSFESDPYDQYSFIEESSICSFESDPYDQYSFQKYSNGIYDGEWTSTPSEETVLSKLQELGKIGSNIFPEHDKQIGPFHYSVLYAVQRWFSANGWPGGTVSITVPHSFRRSQGACVASIKPEYLMTYSEFCVWNDTKKHTLKPVGYIDEDERLKEREVFELVSKKSWLDTLLQIIKCFVVSKITPRIFKSFIIDDREVKMPTLNKNPLCSNVYTEGERILLAWMNRCYEQNRRIVWNEHSDTAVPAARWIVNFDLDLKDGLVLACLIGTYLPFMISSHIGKVYTTPTQKEQYFHNALKIVCALRSLGIEYNIQIKLTNPSVKLLNYSVSIFGESASRFSISKGKSIAIPAKQTVQLPVAYNNTFVDSKTATLVLTGRRQGSELGTHLVFSLVSFTTQVSPQNVISVDSHCYETQTILLELQNPFPVGGEFCVSMTEENVESSSIKGIYLGKGLFQTNSQDLNNPVKRNKKVKSFHCQTQSIYLPESGKGSIEIIFLPFFMGSAHCNVTLNNSVIGDFIYEIKALSKTPLATSLTNFIPDREESSPYFGKRKKHVGTKERKTLVYWKCEVEEQMTELEFYRRTLTNTLESSSRAAEAYVAMTNLTENLLRSWHKERKTLTFNIEYSNRNFSFPNTIHFEVKESRKENILGLQNEHFRVPVTFSAESSGHFECQILLSAKDDIRLYKLECTAYPKGSKIEIEFQTPVLQKTVQDIPVINPTSNIWKLKAIVEGDPFSGPDSLVVPANATAFYPICYRPALEEGYKGKLVLMNGSAVIEDINLIGNATSPLAMGEIVITSEVKANAIHVLNVPNRTKKRLTYEVQSNVPFTSGNPFVSVSSAQVAMYNLHVKPTMGGNFEGIINFVVKKRVKTEVDSDGDEAYSSDDGDEYIGHRLWYIIKLNILQGPPESILHISCPCQESKLIKVPVANPIDEELSLQTIIEGPHLTGPSSIELSAGEKVTYPLTFSPQSILHQKGMLKFFNQNFGEFWYDLVLESKPPSPVNLPYMQCQLGTFISQTISLSNNADQSLDLIPEISDSNFILYDGGAEIKSLHLEPHSVMSVTLTFKPSMLSSRRLPCKVIFHSKRIGQITYFVYGSALTPSEMPPQTVSAVSGASSTFLLNFHNPLNELVYVSVKLSDDKVSMASVFNIDLIKKTSILLGPFQTLGIPIIFSPITRTTYRSVCVVSINRSKEEKWHFKSLSLNTINWTFPIIGIPEYQDIEQMPMSIFECDVRNSASYRLVINLTTNMDDIDDTVLSAKVFNGIDETFPEFASDYEGVLPDISFHLEFLENQARIALVNIVSLQLLKTFTKQDNPDHVVLIFSVNFTPMKNIKNVTHLAITKKNGCVWRFPLTFIADNPVIDDTIVIKSLKLKEKSVARFYLHSNEKVPKEFQVQMTSDSDPEIVVTPKFGVLPVVGERGVELNVLFTPIAYGQENFATLMVQNNLTYDNNFSYRINKSK